MLKSFSDSMSGLQALDSIKVTSKVVMNTAKKLNSLANKTRRLTLCWIKAHMGHEGNEKADDLAKMATTMKFLTSVPRSTSINKNYLANVAQDMWKREWENEITCRQTKQFIPYPDQKEK